MVKLLDGNLHRAVGSDAVDFETALDAIFPLGAAVRACDAEAVRSALLALGGSAEAVLNTQDQSGRTLMDHCSPWATFPGVVEVVQLLLEYRARVDTTDINGNAP